MEMTCNNSSESVAELFRQLEDMHDTAVIPAVVMLVIFAVVGLVGNILVLVVYSKKIRLNPTKVFIMTIASFDLVANFGAIPSDVIALMASWIFFHLGLCKFKIFLASFTTVGGAISLCVVAAIRYRKVCRPYGWQFTITNTIIASISTIIAAFIISIPCIILAGIRTRQNPCSDIQRSDCFFSDEYISTIWTLLYNILFFLIYLSTSVCIIVLYIFIGVTAYKHSKRHGVSGEVTATQKNINSSPKGLAFSDNERIVSVEKQVKPPSMSWSSRVKSGSYLPAFVHILDCCKGDKENENLEEETSSSMNMKNCTTSSDTATEDKTKETTNTDLDTTNTGEPENVRAAANDSQILCLSPADLPVECWSDEAIQRIEVTGSGHKNHTRSNNLAVSEDHKHKHEDFEISTKDYHQKNTSGTNKTTSKSQTPAKKVAKRRPLGRMTAMLIIISAIFVLSYLPFLALTFLVTDVPEKYDSLNMAKLMILNMVYRLYFLNSVLNPIVYSLCDPNFRKECVMFLTLKSRRRSCVCK